MAENNPESPDKVSTPAMTGAEFKVLRKQLGMTQAKLAKCLGVVRSTISAKEAVCSEIDERTADAIRSLLQRHPINAPKAALLPTQGEFELLIEPPHDNDNRAIMPRDWMTHPVFTPGVQQRRELKINDNIWRLGINPLNASAPQAEISMPHVQLLFAVLTFWDKKTKSLPNITLTQLGERLAIAKSGQNLQLILRRLLDLRNYWVSVETPNGDRVDFPMIEIQQIRTKYQPGKNDEEFMSRRIEGLRIHNDFAGLLSEYSKTLHLNFSAFVELGSNLAQSIYLYLPSRSKFASKEKPFELNLEKLWDQLCLPKTSKSLREKRLTQHEPNSIMDQLDGARILNGRLRVKLVPTKNNADYKIQSWIDDVTVINKLESKPMSKLFDAWIASGRSQALFEARISKADELETHEIELLEKCGVNIAKTERFMSNAKALLGESRFGFLLSEAKADYLEGRSGESPTAILIWRITTEIRQKK